MYFNKPKQPITPPPPHKEYLNTSVIHSGQMSMFLGVLMRIFFPKQ